MSAYGGRGGGRWDTDRFVAERDRYEEIDRRGSRSGRGGFEEDRFRERIYDFEPEPRREPVRRPRGESITIEREKEREYFASPSPPPRRAPARPGFLRRQSSLDTFDRKPLYREEYGPPARREIYRPVAYEPIPLPRARALPPPRRYAERDFEEIKIAEPEFYGDEEFRPYPERIREREVIRTRRRSRSKESRVRSNSSSSSSSSSSGTTEVSKVSKRSEFPKRGKTRMPAKLVSKKAIIELGYPFEDEGQIIIIQKALGRENIDEVIKLSEVYKESEKAQMSGGRSNAGNIIEERRTQETFTSGPPAPQMFQVDPPPGMFEVDPGQQEFLQKTTIERREVSPARTVRRSRSVGPLAGPLVLMNSGTSERSIQAEIKALEAEKEALRAERRAQKELRKADRLRREGRGEMMGNEVELYKEGSVYSERSTRKEYVEEKEEGGVPVDIQKDRKASQKKRARAFMSKTLT